MAFVILLTLLVTDGRAVRHTGVIRVGSARITLAGRRFDFTGLGESERGFSRTNFSSNVDDDVVAAEFLAAAYAPRLRLAAISMLARDMRPGGGHPAPRLAPRSIPGTPLLVMKHRNTWPSATIAVWEPW